MHEVPSWVREGSFFLITICCDPRGANQLCNDACGIPLLNGAAFYHEKMFWHCRLMLLMPDHLHAVIAFPREPGLAHRITHWKHFHSEKLGIRWQRDFFDHRLRNDHEMREKMSYVLRNPVRRGLCATAEDWRWVYRPMDRVAPSW